MGRKVCRVPVVLDPSDEPPTPDETDAILRPQDLPRSGCGLRRAGLRHDPVDASCPGLYHRPQVLWRRGETSPVERWYAKVHGNTN